MEIDQLRIARGGQWSAPPRITDPQLVMVFGIDERDASASPIVAQISNQYPRAAIVGCSTAGTIEGATTFDDHVAVTAIKFAKTTVRCASAPAADGGAAAAFAIANALHAPDLAHLLVLSEGVNINGSALVSGFREHLPAVGITGGLAGDGGRMQRTFVIVDGKVASNLVVGVGLYGTALRVGIGCVGGWKPFGPERLITRSAGNVLHALDEQPALELYRRYLGKLADGLPATGLLFPMEIRPPRGGPAVVRTLLGIDPELRTVRFAGDMPEGYFARLMTASVANLLDGAGEAARHAAQIANAELAVLVSCVGRRMLLGQRTDDELATIRDVLGNVPTTGFYSYGELGPFGALGCELHNQTMTITTFAEA